MLDSTYDVYDCVIATVSRLGDGRSRMGAGFGWLSDGDLAGEVQFARRFWPERQRRSRVA
jgi:hypothetical protein